MQLRSISLLAVSICLLAAMPTAPASGVTIRMPYEGAAPFAFSSVAEECSKNLPRSLGVVCTSVPPGAHTLVFGVKDASTLAVGGTWYAYDGPTFVSSGVHCNGASLPVKDVSLVVVRLELIGGPLSCAEAGQTASGEATKGLVRFDFA